MSYQNIKNNNIRSLDAVLVNDKYYDYMLFKGETSKIAGSGECLSSYIDMNNPDCLNTDGSIQSVSSYTWEKAYNYGVEVESGLTSFGTLAVDNGRLHYDKDLITNKKFLEIYTSGLTIESGSTNLVLYPVTGNTKKYTYETEIVTENGGTYLACKGGFYQGFFKLEDYDYQVLPNYIDCDWHFEIMMRPRTDYEICTQILNDTHPLNEGIFFYIGTRAENKFGEIYNKIQSKEASGYTKSPAYSGDDLLSSSPYYNIASLLDNEPDTSISGMSIDDRFGYFEIDTDNKHIFFDRTPSGYTVHKWMKEVISSGTEPIITLTGYTTGDYKINPFLLYHRGISGLTSKDREEYLASTKEDYDIEKDIVGNALALKYNSDGSITLKYTIKNCDVEEGYETIEETTKKNLILKDQWNLINVRLGIVDPCKFDKCGNPIGLGTRKMRVSIYVNGYLVYVSKELPELILKSLNDTGLRQLGVPYNISIGGGTQGLAEMIWLDYLKPVQNEYEIEREYAGTFIGDIQSFAFYTCMQDYATIKKAYDNKFGEEKQQKMKKVIYVGFGNSYTEIINDKYAQVMPDDEWSKTIVTHENEGDGLFLFIIIPDNSKLTLPKYFLPSSSLIPVSMTRETLEYDNKKYTVYTSNQLYSKSRVKIMKLKAIL